MERPDPPAVDDRSDDEATPRIDVGVLIAHSPGADAKPLQSFAERLAPPLARVGVASTRRLRGLDRGVVGGLIGTPLCTDSRFQRTTADRQG